MARAIIYCRNASIIPFNDGQKTQFVPRICIKEEPEEVQDDVGHAQENQDNAEFLSTEQSPSTSKQPEEETTETAQISRREIRRSAAVSIVATKEMLISVHSKGTDSTSVHNRVTKKSSKYGKSRKSSKIKKATSKAQSRTRGPQKWQCEICFTFFSSEYYMKSHQAHYNPKAIKCAKCKNIFSNVYDYAHHRIYGHRNVQPLTASRSGCEDCKLVFKTKTEVQQHILHYHDPNNPPENPRARRISSQGPKVPLKDQGFQKKSSPSRVDSNLTTERIAEKRKRAKSVSDTDSLNNERTTTINTRSSSHKATFLAPEYEITTNDQLLDKTLPEKSLPSSKTLDDSPHPPLVQIYAIPNEVKSLLYDCEATPSKRIKLQVLSNKNTDDNTKINFDSSKSLSPTPPVKLKTLSLASTRRISTLKENFNCLDCSVQLEKLDSSLNSSKDEINSPLTSPKTPQKSRDIPNIKQSTPIESNIESSTLAIRGTVGIELENLDLALKKLETPQTTIDSSSSDISDISPLDESLEEINLEHSYSTTSSEEKRPAKSRHIYLSGTCRTRFTTQKKLIYHYLHYHSSPNHICAVCRTECTNLGELKKHLVLHCITIPKSPDDKSPIDLKGPCENYKKKFTCKGCKKRFWTTQCLEDHKQLCQMLEKKEKKRRSGSNEDDLDLHESLVSNLNVQNLLLQSSSSLPEVKEPEIMPEVIPQVIPEVITVVENNQDTRDLNYPLATVEVHVNVDDNPRLTERNVQSLNFWSQYTHSDVLNRQRIGVNPNFSYQCNVCHSQFQTAANLLCHEKRYLVNQIMHRCDKCGTSFPSVGLLTAHKKAAHNIDSMIYKVYCLICDQGFSARKYLRQHTLHIHENEPDTPFSNAEYKMICRICDVTFKCRKQFVQHTMYYYNDRIISCNMCGKEFYGLYKLHAHSKQVHIAKEVMSFKHLCKLCQDRFPYESHLISHMFHVHGDQMTNIRCENQQHQIYKCPTCAELFNSRVQLTEHEIEFSNSGNYDCNYCERKCQTMLVLQIHKKRSHYEYGNSNLKKCPLCSEVVLQRYYVSHYKHFHNNTNNQLAELSSSSMSKADKSLQHSDISSTLIDDRNLTNYGSWFPSEAYSDNLIEYTCALCDMKFMSDQELKIHRNNHGYDNSMALQQKDLLEEHEFAYNLNPNNQDPLEGDPPLVTYDDDDDDDDTKCNFSIANICSVQLEEYDSLINPETGNEMSALNETFNSISNCDCHHSRVDTDWHQKHKEATCNEPNTRNIKQLQQHIQREFPASNQELEKLKNKETAELHESQKNSTRTSSVSDPKLQQKDSPLHHLQTSIRQYFRKSITASCDMCGLVVDNIADLISHKLNTHQDCPLSPISHVQNQNVNYSPSNINIINTSSPLIINEHEQNQKSSSDKEVEVMIIDDEPNVVELTDVPSRMEYNDLQNHSLLGNQSTHSDHGYMSNCLVSPSILQSRLQQPLN